MKVVIDRDYVIVCNRHKGIANGGALLFWGGYTKNEEERSFGGYTSNFEECEKYTLEEATDKKGYNFSVYKGEKLWGKHSDFVIRIDQLEKLGYRPMKIYYR